MSPGALRAKRRMVARELEDAGVHQGNGLAQGKMVVLRKKFWI